MPVLHAMMVARTPSVLLSQPAPDDALAVTKPFHPEATCVFSLQSSLQRNAGTTTTFVSRKRFGYKISLGHRKS